MSEPQKDEKTSEVSDGDAVAGKKGDYVVGYGRPPKDTRFPPGVSGNPRGRPKGSQNLKTIVERKLKEPSDPAQKSKSKRKRSRLETIVDVHTEKAALGDYRSTNVVLKLIETAGVFKEESGDADNTPDQVGTRRLSEALVEGMDSSRLAREEQAELSRLAESFDENGMAVPTDDLLLFQQLVNKAVGIMPAERLA